MNQPLPREMEIYTEQQQELRNWVDDYCDRMAQVAFALFALELEELRGQDE